MCRSKKDLTIQDSDFHSDDHFECRRVSSFLETSCTNDPKMGYTNPLQTPAFWIPHPQRVFPDINVLVRSYYQRFPRSTCDPAMGWLRLVGSLKLQVSFAKEPCKRDEILHKRPVFLRSLLIVATPYPRFLRSTCDLCYKRSLLQKRSCYPTMGWFRSVSSLKL